MEKSKQIEWINILRGFAIFLIVFGHAILKDLLVYLGTCLLFMCLCFSLFLVIYFKKRKKKV